jgi:haloalkane dehalogenase
MNYKLIKKTLLSLMILSSTTTAAQSISAEFPFQSNYQEINTHNLHYIDTGKGDPILFLHGIPMSAYSWRNVIPHLSDTARCLAIDFMGFGQSDKPKIDYSYDDQYHYLYSFIDALKLDNITLVMTDIGGIVGQKYARLHPEKIKGMVFMETPLTDAVTFHKTGGIMQHMLFKMGAKDKMGYKMFVKKNMFIKMMSMLIKRKLTKAEKAVYAAPFETIESRIPMFKLANGFPKKGNNAQVGDMGDYLNKNAAWLVTSEHPKLLITAKPGMLVNKKVVSWANTNLKNMQIDEAGKAKHLMEEDLPHQIGNSIRNWYLKL